MDEGLRHLEGVLFNEDREERFSEVIVYPRGGALFKVLANALFELLETFEIADILGEVVVDFRNLLIFYLFYRAAKMHPFRSKALEIVILGKIDIKLEILVLFFPGDFTVKVLRDHFRAHIEGEVLGLPVSYPLPVYGCGKINHRDVAFFYPPRLFLRFKGGESLGEVFEGLFDILFFDDYFFSLHLQPSVIGESDFGHDLKRRVIRKIAAGLCAVGFDFRIRDGMCSGFRYGLGIGIFEYRFGNIRLHLFLEPDAQGCLAGSCRDGIPEF